MRNLLPTLSVACLVLAGCAGAPASSDTSSTVAFDDLKGDATETTGLIRGVVVNPSIVPIPNALVSIAGATKHNVTADDQGRFLVDKLTPGTYLIKAKAPLHHEAQTTVEVVADVDEPAITKIQLLPFFDQKPFSVPVKQTGFFQCSQGAGIVYSSSNCVVNYCKARADAETCAPLNPLDNITSQEREWHMDVGEGWQQIVFEMTWQRSSEYTAAGMGLVVSTYKPTRNTAHNFANFESCNPLRGQLDVGVDHESSQIPDGDPVYPDNLTRIPARGLERVSFFASVRECPTDPNCVPGIPFFGDACPPPIAYEQKFEVIIHQFYYGLPKEGWSFVAGDKVPF